jgi:hypothetical protein
MPSAMKLDANICLSCLGMDQFGIKHYRATRPGWSQLLCRPRKASFLSSFFRAEFTQVYANRFGSRVAPAENAVAVQKHAKA